MSNQPDLTLTPSCDRIVLFRKERIRKETMVFLPLLSIATIATALWLVCSDRFTG